MAFAGCTTDDLTNHIVTDNSFKEESISFGFNMESLTRADIGGDAAANLLGDNFYVTGTKGTEAANSPSPTLVFDNYLVHYDTNTAGTTTSNTANWEYVGVTPGMAPTADYVKLSSLVAQTIKFWDYSADQYDFMAFSTGTYKAVAGTSGADDEIGVTAMKYGTALAGSATAYTFDMPSVDAIKNTYITDITEVSKADYGKEVTLKFKNIGSKVRVALYETVPGYAVKDVQFYQVDGTTDFSGTKSATATLISATGLPIKGTIDVSFPQIGTDSHGAAAYDRAAATVTPAAVDGTEPFQTFGTLSNFATSKEGYEVGSNYLGRTSPTATFAGSAEAGYYTTMFPVSSSSALTLRVDYTLVSVDGSAEEIHIKGAKAVVPSVYTKWQPNYAYTYIFKISDDTNGWTGTGGDPAGLFPITFDAVVAEATDFNAEQTTVTTVATPSITTYQENHNYTMGEFSVTSGKDIYVMVMDNSTTPATLIGGLGDTNSRVYLLSRKATEAEVLDALTMRTTAVASDDVTGRNGLVLTKVDAVDNTVTEIINGVDGNPITGITPGTASKISISALSADKSYAYIYVSSTSTEEVNRFDLVSVTVGNPISSSSSGTFYKLTKAQVAAGTTLTAAEAPDDAYIYFSVTGTGTSSVIYSYINSLGKTSIPAGCVKVAKSSLASATGDTNAEADTFYFETYLTNNGKYVARVIQTTSASDPVPPTPSSTDALTFEAKEAGAVVTFTKGTSVANQIEYSTDGGTTWATYSAPITLTNVGDKVSFRGNNPAYGVVAGADNSRFSCSKDCYVYGNIMSLINPTGFATATVLTAPHTFKRMFGDSHIYSHPTRKLELPATTLTPHCYDSMFESCDKLTVAPDLPATTLASYCYNRMFSTCWSLTVAPSLPATTLSDYCYYQMFEGCLNLTTAPSLPATSLAEYCYDAMFEGCTNLTTAPATMPATTLAEGCYSAMFQGCTSLAAAPVLPATTMASRCYLSMFDGCTNLTAAPSLPAATLSYACYSFMFRNCTHLNSVKCLATDISATGCTLNWLSGVAASGTFTKATGVDWSGKTGSDGIPSGWTVVEQ